MSLFDEYKKAKSPIVRKRIAEQIYIEYCNDFLTISGMADYYGVSELMAGSIINEGRHWNGLPKITELKGGE